MLVMTTVLPINLVHQVIALSYLNAKRGRMSKNTEDLTDGAEPRRLFRLVSHSDAAGPSTSLDTEIC